ncbi:MAG TPA: M12 family metallo-peptidase, partial [Pyrinomonadaceae bacterium]|nr:M12 family metallo-peptidase [Pyrinomonadaceae bacterium]
MKTSRRARRLWQTACGSSRLILAVFVLAGCLSALTAFKSAVEAAKNPATTTTAAQPAHGAPAASLNAAADEQDVETRKLDKVLRRYDTLDLDAGQAAAQVRSDGRLTLHTAAAGTLEFELEPNDLRATNYRAEETRDGGEVRVLDADASPVRTFKGSVRGNERAAARFTIDDHTVEGLVLVDGEKYFVEMKRKYDKSAAPTEFLFYKESDVIEASPVSCGATLNEKMKHAGEVVSLHDSHAALDAAGAIPLNREIKLATEADYEYVAALGGSEAADDEILSILNLIEGVYQNELGLSFSVVYQHTWATPDDPYQSSAPGVALAEFKNYWNTNYTHVSRDTAHRWTGKDLDGDVIGSAEIGAVCLSPSRAYGLSQKLFETDIKVGITAHELGHNLGATHPDQEPSAGNCFNSIMQSQVGYSRSFCPYSRQQIATYVDNNASCLARTYAISGQITSEAFGSHVVLSLTGAKTKTFEVILNTNTGGYTLRGLTPGTYTVAVSGQFQNVTPASRTVTIFDGDITGIDFALTLARFKVGGRLTNVNNVGLAGITVSISTPSALVAQTTSDAGGNYLFEVPATRDYRVSPYSPDGHFTPIDRSTGHLAGDKLDLNFVGTIRTPLPTPTPTPTPTPIKDLSGSIAFVASDQVLV